MAAGRGFHERLHCRFFCAALLIPASGRREKMVVAVPKTTRDGAKAAEEKSRARK